LSAVIDIAMRGLPHAFHDVSAELGQTVAIDVSGPSGGHWTLIRNEERWALWRGEPPSATTSIRLTDQTAWKLLFNALPEGDAGHAVRIEGRPDLGRAFLHARSVIV
jgi:hypothetical protein